MLDRIIDETYPDVVRRVIGPLTLARLAINAVYRFAPPFLATIARGLDVDLADLGVALAVTEVSGLASPVIGRVVDRVPRKPAMVVGLVGIATGAVVAGLSPGIVVFTLGLLVLTQSKIVFDVGLISWTADHVPYDRRGRIIGIIETSWALGLLIGVTTLGLVAAVTSWRWSYVLGAVGVVAAAGLLVARLDAGVPAPHRERLAAGVGRRLRASGWAALLGMFGLMAASQSVFVTFGAWMEDDFGVGTAGLAAVTFGIGALELAASTMSAARTDRWGKERSISRGAAVMVPLGLTLALFDGHLGIGLVALAAYIGVFEFGVVSAIPIGGELVPGAPGRGIGIFFAAGTVGRAATAIPATRLYDRYGFGAAAVTGTVFALVASIAMLVRRRLLASEAPR